MTLEEKVGQIIHVGIKGKNLNSLAIRDIQKLHVGGIILFAANLGDKESIKKLNGDLQSLSISSSGIPLFISIDQEGGRVARIPNDSSPGALAMGQTGNPIYAEDVGFVTAYNLKKLGFNMNLAPVLDVNSNPDNPVINTRSFGSDPELVASMGISHAKGIREALVVPVVKHFPGHGDTNTDSHLALPKINKSLEDLEKMELLPFRRSIEKGAEAVMSAHILFPALDGEAPATLSPAILKGILRNKYKYDGLIFTDAMEMHAISKRYKPEESAKKAFLAGVDIILLTTTGSDTERIYNALLSAFKSGELIESDLDRSVLRQISLKFRNGYFHSLDSRYANHELKKYFSEKSEGVERKFSRIAKRYNNRTLYETVAMDGIRSLRREYTIPDFKEKKNLKFYYSTLSMKSFALSRGIPEENIMPFGIPSVISVLRSNKANYHCIVEINEFNLRAWNQIVLQIAEHSNPEQKNIPTLVGLYTGNPFLDIKIPATGAVLASFSPTEESLKALLDTYLEKKVVRKANLILHVER
jgi:beta-N-acetylhexosaminidase